MKTLLTSFCRLPEELRVSVGEEAIHPLARGCANAAAAAAAGEEREGPRAKGERRRAQQGRRRVRVARSSNAGIQQEGRATPQERADHAQSERDQGGRRLTQK